ncbi:hypothetical protein A6A05_19230 [Magnetospirillum moscoviense]|uniref:KilA-N DNA-binding domain-containing protein n=1 Tax=Magnetospirillum moscoviense TaxID=1437059 RepID=A0A178N0U5_9PROT|nr:hypothetical protein A6A05_19230 [Magnetospirillum moscoviense]
MPLVGKPRRVRSSVRRYDLIEEGGEVRVLDLTLAERLGFSEARMIRKLIKRHASSLEAIGNSLHRVTKSEGRGRPATAFYLTEGQALFILAKSETARANIELAYVVVGHARDALFSR